MLYRHTDKDKTSDVQDGNAATKRVLSDAITLFGLDSLTNSKPAFINFTSDLIIDDLPMLASPQEIVVELLEDIEVTPEIIAKISKLKELGYTIALDDYIGDVAFDALLPYADILKVDFILTNRDKQRSIAQSYKGNIRLLAEKVETLEEFHWAKSLGYSLFQGYFFAYPNTFKKKVRQISTHTYLMLLSELGQDDTDLHKCAQIIRTDAVLTFRMLQKINTLEFAREREITDIGMALMMMGTDQFRRWLLLVIARDNNQTSSNELTRASYVRGLWAETLMTYSPRARDHENGFLLGMFSLLNRILDEPMTELLKDINLNDEVQDALLDRGENFYSKLLQFVIDSEKAECRIDLADLGINITPDEVYTQYAKCLAAADLAFETA